MTKKLKDMIGSLVAIHLRSGSILKGKLLRTENENVKLFNNITVHGKVLVMKTKKIQFIPFHAVNRIRELSDRKIEQMQNHESDDNIYERKLEEVEDELKEKQKDRNPKELGYAKKSLVTENGSLILVDEVDDKEFVLDSGETKSLMRLLNNQLNEKDWKLD